MSVEVPEAFLKALASIRGKIDLSSIIQAIEWASRNPEEAVKVAETIMKLGRSGKSAFAFWISCGDSPDRALEHAVRYDAKERKVRIFRYRAYAALRKGEFKFNLENGVECSVRREGDNYLFTFKVKDGREISFLYMEDSLSRVLRDLAESGSLPAYDLLEARYRGKSFSVGLSKSNATFAPDMVRALILAVEKNEAPEVILTAGLVEPF